MHLCTFILAAYCVVNPTQAVATIQGACTKHDAGLSWLAAQMSAKAVISCLGSPLQKYNAGRYWGLQHAKNASVVVFPTTTEEVASAMKATSMTPLGADFAFVGGAHGMLRNAFKVLKR